MALSEHAFDAHGLVPEASACLMSEVTWMPASAGMTLLGSRGANNWRHSRVGGKPRQQPTNVWAENSCSHLSAAATRFGEPPC